MGFPGSGDTGRDGVRDYIRAKLEEMATSDLAPTKKAAKAAKKRRDFLTEQLKIASGDHPGKVKLNARLVREAQAAEVSARHTLPGRPRRDQEPDRPAEDSPKRPYWARCEKMGFGELRDFVDESLQDLGGAVAEDRPHWKGEFLDLLGLLYRQVEVEAGAPPEGPDASAVQSPELRKLRTKREGLARELARAFREMSSADRGKGKRQSQRATKLRRELEILGQKIRREEAEEKERLANPRTEAQRLRQRDAKRWEVAERRWEVAERRWEVAERRRQIVSRIGRDIERAFSAGGPRAGTTRAAVSAGRLPWRVLPPGELSLQRILVHYERLGRARPDIRYEPERIEKAYSLGPDGCYVGAGEFDGYVVFTFPRTNKALLERPVYGNAIYVLGPDWKRLSRLSKRELLADETHGVTRIVHKGDWFARTKLALGLR